MLTFAASVVVATSWGHHRLSDLHRCYCRREQLRLRLADAQQLLVCRQLGSLELLDAELWEDEEAKAVARQDMLLAHAEELAAAIAEDAARLAEALPTVVLHDGTLAKILDVSRDEQPLVSVTIADGVSILCSPEVEVLADDGTFAPLVDGLVAQRVTIDGNDTFALSVGSPAADFAYTLHLDGGASSGCVVGNSSAAGLITR